MKCYKVKIIEETDILIIDEVSMLGSNILNKINEIFKKVRNNSEHFGGIRMIFCSDMFQLPPISDDCIIDYEKWDNLNVKYVESITWSIPLKIGYAMTINSSQGRTLSGLTLIIDDLFKHHQFYSALSRAKFINNVYISSLEITSAKNIFEKIKNEIKFVDENNVK